jgi:hypothetical protein
MIDGGEHISFSKYITCISSLQRLQYLQLQLYLEQDVIGNPIPWTSHAAIHSIVSPPERDQVVLETRSTIIEICLFAIPTSLYSLSKAFAILAMHTFAKLLKFGIPTSFQSPKQKPFHALWRAYLPPW